MSFSSLAVQGLQQTTSLLPQYLSASGALKIALFGLISIAAVIDNASSHRSLMQHMGDLYQSEFDTISNHWNDTFHYVLSQDSFLTFFHSKDDAPLRPLAELYVQHGDHEPFISEYPLTFKRSPHDNGILYGVKYFNGALPFIRATGSQEIGIFASQQGN